MLFNAPSITSHSRLIWFYWQWKRVFSFFLMPSAFLKSRWLIFMQVIIICLIWWLICLEAFLTVSIFCEIYWIKRWISGLEMKKKMQKRTFRTINCVVRFEPMIFQNLYFFSFWLISSLFEELLLSQHEFL